MYEVHVRQTANCVDNLQRQLLLLNFKENASMSKPLKKTVGVQRYTFTVSKQKNFTALKFAYFK